MAFPQLAPAAEREYPSALLEGTLLLDGGCLRVRASEGGTSYLVVWPPQAELNASSGTVRVLDSHSRVAAQAGGPIRLGGGEVDSSVPVLRALRTPLPTGCPGPLWLASSIVATPP
ncbi:MAG TPA: hypothetical protein VHG28_23280 [Longimicrobiaceae bacterium]|nr:hypothetical protein [Longimicrobiaceae bacterium]